MLGHVSHWDPTGCSPPGSSVHGILQARTLGWVASPSSRGSSPPRDRIGVSCVSYTADRFFPGWAIGEALYRREWGSLSTLHADVGVGGIHSGGSSSRARGLGFILQVLGAGERALERDVTESKLCFKKVNMPSTIKMSWNQEKLEIGQVGSERHFERGPSCVWWLLTKTIGILLRILRSQGLLSNGWIRGKKATMFQLQISS